MTSQGQRFRRRALRRGYKVDEVDGFLDRVEATLAGDEAGAPVSSQEVHDVVFRVRFGGYDEWQVDLHLDRVERQLAERESGVRQPAGDGGRQRDAFGRGEPPAGAPVRPGPGDREAYAGAGRYDQPTIAGTERDQGEYARGPGEFSRGGAPAEPGYPPGQEFPGRGLGRHGKAEMTSEMRQLPEREAPAAGAPAGPYAGGPPGRPEGAAPETAGGFGPPPSGRPEPGRPEPGRPEPAGPPSGYGDRGPAEPAGPYAGAGRPEPGPGFRGGRGDAEYDVRESGPEYGGPPRAEAPPAAFGGPGRGEPTPPPYGAPGRGEPNPPPYGGPGRHEDGTAFPGAGRDEPAPRFGERSEGGYRQPEPPPGFGAPPRPEPGFGTPGAGGGYDQPPPAAGGPGQSQEFQRVEALRRGFQPRRFGSGYDPAEVDRLFDGILTALAGRGPMPVSPNELERARFDLVPGGYFEAEVEAALREVSELLRRY